MSNPHELLAAYEPIENGRLRVADPEIMELAQEILRLFCLERPKHTPGRVTFSKASIPRFYEAGKLCKERGMTPDVYVRQILTGMGFTGHFWPSAIASAKCLEASERGNLTSIDLGRYKAALAAWQGLAKTLGPELAIRDPQSPFSPLLRMLLAKEYGYTDIADAFMADAIAEYKASTTAREVFEELMLQYAINPE